VEQSAGGWRGKTQVAKSRGPAKHEISLQRLNIMASGGCDADRTWTTEKDSIFAADSAYFASMNETDLNRMLQRAATTVPAMPPATLEHEIMARVRLDDGRTRRWRSFVLWVLALTTLSGILTAGVIGWSKALQDHTHSKPPRMKLFQEGLPK
jgi:hypothetical protein